MTNSRKRALLAGAALAALASTEPLLAQGTEQPPQDGTPSGVQADTPAAPSVTPSPGAQLPAVRVIGEAIRDNVTEGTHSYTPPSTSAATGLDLAPRETPQSVSVITRQRMDDQGLMSLGDVMNQVTGLTIFGKGGASTASYSWINSRGYTISNVLLDGVLVPMSLFAGGSHEDWGSLDSAVFDSVTVVRGANGLLTGAGEPSGTIAVTRKRPTEVFEASGSVSVGRWRQHRGTVDLGGPLTEDGRLRGRLVAVYEKGNSWLDRYRGYESTLYGVLEAHLTPRDRLTVALEHGRTTGLGAGPYTGFNTAFEDGTPTPFARGRNAYTDWSSNRVKRTNASLGYEHRFNEDWTGQVQFVAGKRTSDRKFGNLSASPALDGITPVYLRRIGGEDKPRAYFASLDGRYRLWGREHKFTAGLNGYSSRERDRPGNTDYFDDDISSQAFTWTGRFPEPDWSSFEPWTRSEYKTDQVGLFVNNQLKLLDSLALLTGARLSNWRTRTTNLDTGEITDDRKQNREFTPFIGLVYDVTPSLSAYASYTTIFQPQNNRNQAGELLDPEVGKSYELGLKGAWFDDRLNASVAVFETRKDNLAVADGGQTPTGDDSYVAVDETKGRGWEFEVAGELRPGWSLQAGYGRAVIRDSADTRLNTEVPKQNFKLFTTWRPAALNDLTVGAGLNWQSKAYAGWAGPAFLEASTIKSYAVVNLMANYRINKHLDLNLNLSNLFDRAYRVDETGHDYGSPRALMATLRYQL